eukprot:7183774-Alexandrium_andersonii.AAC.1
MNNRVHLVVLEHDGLWCLIIVERRARATLIILRTGLVVLMARNFGTPGPGSGPGAVSYTHLTLPTICSV